MVINLHYSAGEYAEKGDQTLVVSGTYHTVESVSVNFLEIFRSIPEGLISGGEIVFYIFLVGGAFGIIHKTGAFENGVNKAMRMLGKANFLMIPLTNNILYIRFTIGLAEETIIFVPIGIIIARTLGYDALTGAAMVILGAASGFSGGMLNPLQLVWHKPLLNYQCSRLGFTYNYLFIYLNCSHFYMLYARKVKKDKSKVLCMS